MISPFSIYERISIQKATEAVPRPYTRRQLPITNVMRSS